MPIDKLQEFYKKFYQPDNAVLMVAGKIDEATCCPLISGYFGPIPAPARGWRPTYTVEPAAGWRAAGHVAAGGRYPGCTGRLSRARGIGPRLSAFNVLLSPVGDNPSGRLYKALVDNKKAAQVFGSGLQLDEPGLPCWPRF